MSSCPAPGGSEREQLVPRVLDITGLSGVGAAHAVTIGEVSVTPDGGPPRLG